MTCPSCGEAVPEDSRFCGNCGHEMAAPDSDQRRVVTVLFADLVGFTSLSEGTDPEQVKRVVDDCFEGLVAIVETFGGRVDKIIGDAILALFGAPVGHEDDAERAVRAALRMQETLRDQPNAADLRLRIGVNTGEVLVGALRSGGDYTAMGDVVNTAQRLQSAARPGQVLVGAATHVAAGDRITYEALGPLRVRGRGERVEAWLAVDTLQPPGGRTQRVDGPLVGRRSEMAVLTGEVDLAVSRRRAQMILLVGDAGMGKTRLARELSAYAADRHGAWVLEGRCVPYGEANVWWPVAEALRKATGLRGDATADEARAAVTALTARLRSVDRDDPDVARITDGILELLGYEGALREIDPGRARDEAMRALIDLTDDAAAGRPVVIVLDDLHWADEAVLDTIDQLTSRLSRNPYVVLGTARDGIHDQWAPQQGRHNTTVMHIEPLDRDAADSLLTVLLGDQGDGATRDDLLDRSGGNPFFLEELVTLLDETGSADRAGEAVGASEGVAELSGLPDSLRGLVVARLDALDDEERAVVEDAAVLGRGGQVEALEIMGTVRGAAGEVRSTIAALVDKEVLLVDDDTWTFRSDLVRDVAYGTMTKARRAASHAGIATWYEKHLGGPESADSVIDRMAHHYGTAAELVADMGGVEGVPDDVRGRALHWIGVASARALESEHHLVGSRLFSDALLLLGDAPTPERWQALLGRSRCRANLRDLEGAVEDAEAVRTEADLAGEAVMVGRALTALGDARQKLGDVEAARADLTDAVSRLTEAGADRERGEALRMRGMTELFAGELDAAHLSIAAALEVARAVGDRQGEAWALQNLAWLAFEMGQAHDAEQWIEQSVEAFTEIGDSGGLGWALGLAAWVKLHLGEREEAAALATRLLPEAGARGDRWAEAMLHMLVASGHLWSGRAAESLEPFEQAEVLFERAGDEAGVNQSRVGRGRALLLLGRIADGWPLLGSVGTGPVGDRIGVDGDRTSLIGLTLGSVAIGDPTRMHGVLDHLDESAIDIEAIGGVDLLAGMALVHVQLGDVERAGSLVDRFLPADGSPSPALAAAAALIDVARGRRDEAVRLAQSVPDAPRSTFLDRWMAAMAMGLMAAGDGDGATKAEHFASARAELDGTDDRLDAAVLALLEAEAGAALGQPVEGDRERAESAWRSFGVDPAGWRTVAARALDPIGLQEA